MGRSRQKSTQLGVLAHPSEARSLGDATWPDREAIVETCEEEFGGPLERLLERSPEAIVVAGDDRFVGRVITAYQRRPALKKKPLRIYPTNAEGSSRLAAELDSEHLGASLVRKLVAEVDRGGLSRRQIPTLKVTLSSDSAAMYGFSLGAGLFYKLFDAFLRASGTRTTRVGGTLARLGRDTLLEAGANLEPTAGKIAVDHRPEAESVGYVLASTLASSWLGLSMREAGTLALRMGDSGGELVRQVATSNALPGFVRSQRARQIDALDIDWSAPFVLDGDLVEPGCAHVLHLQEGPKVHCVEM